MVDSGDITFLMTYLCCWVCNHYYCLQSICKLPLTIPHFVICWGCTCQLGMIWLSLWWNCIYNLFSSVHTSFQPIIFVICQMLEILGICYVDISFHNSSIIFAVRFRPNLWFGVLDLEKYYRSEVIPGEKHKK